MGCTADGVAGNHLYSGRALGMTQPGDVIQLHPQLQSQWPYISAHYERVGLEITDEIVWDVERHRLAECPNLDTSVFHFGAPEHAARPNQDWYKAVDYINSKNNFAALAEELGVPIPATHCFTEVAEIGDAAIREMTFPGYLKTAISVGGVGVYRCATERDLRALLGYLRPGAPVQFQTEVSSDCFLNLQYEVKGDGLSRHAATEQVLEGPVHQGNRYPAREEPWDCVEPMAHWLHEKGMRGVFAFDVAVTGEAGHRGYSAIECNPRFNGASYPTAIAKKLGIEHWLARNFKTGYRTLAEIDLSGLEYDRVTGQGVILVNWGTVLVGVLMCLLAGPPELQERLALELHKGL
jgi:hypothetical protein